ncbi:hypothetical protein [Brevundimonas sp.]|uniref:hypothetical protein n=1 Tax=Brevundimonas sp. TaxID=1871086 RepID=UPI0022BB6718|nr:hypothetical protein [Brevundimonas sp.]MCZ8195289.1 hypothetical protein [Brevundimonas sp.]
MEGERSGATLAAAPTTALRGVTLPPRGAQRGPSMVINGTSLISGGQPAAVFEEALRKIAGDG